jgi:Trk K+ transport system NAD-binding subunit
MPSQLSYFLGLEQVKRNLRALAEFLAVIALAILIYSTVFHFIMEHEGRHYSWVTGLYWTLTVMSTLGFGDITFTSDLGRMFSMVVLLSGIVFLLIMLPFTFIRFFYAPWLESQAQSRAPRELPSGITNHVIITNQDPVSASLIRKLEQYHYDYVIAVSDVQAAADLHDKGYNVVVGYLDKPETYRDMRVEQAALVLVNNNDIINTNIAATIREVSESVPIVTNADLDDSLDILELAGATHVFQFAKMLGVAMAQHTLGASAQANILGGFGELLIAEAHAFHTPFEGKPLIESRLRELTGINVIGIWKRGVLEAPHPRTLIDPSTILLLAGSEEHFRRYDEFIGSHRTFEAPVVILGGGRVGQAAADTLSERGVDFRVVEQDESLLRDDERFILGSAADIHTLERAGISHEAPTVLITTHDDDVNIYLTIYCGTQAQHTDHQQGHPGPQYQQALYRRGRHRALLCVHGFEPGAQHPQARRNHDARGRAQRLQGARAPPSHGEDPLREQHTGEDWLQRCGHPVREGDEHQPRPRRCLQERRRTHPHRHRRGGEALHRVLLLKRGPEKHRPEMMIASGNMH